MPKKANGNIRFTECSHTNFIPIAEAGGLQPCMCINELYIRVLFLFCFWGCDSAEKPCQRFAENTHKLSDFGNGKCVVFNLII